MTLAYCYEAVVEVSQPKLLEKLALVLKILLLKSESQKLVTLHVLRVLMKKFRVILGESIGVGMHVG